MGTEELRTAVLREAEAEASGVLEAGRAQSVMTSDAERMRLENQRRHVLEERKQRVDHDRVVSEASLKVESRNALLLRKQQLIEEVFSEAERRIGSDAEAYAAFLRWAIDQIPPAGPVRIVCRPEDREVVQGLLSTHPPMVASVVESPAGTTELGLMVLLADSEVDLTLRAACQNLRERTLVDVASDLFRIEG